MLNQNHPDDERLAAVAGNDPEAAADPGLASHVAGCTRCADLVTELGALRASLAELPDLAPSRPLRLLPPVTEPEPAAADRLAGWVRRLFAPVLTAGATLAMVGLVGTAAPAMEGPTAAEPDEARQDLEAASEPAAAQGGADGEAGERAAAAASDAPSAEGDTLLFDDDRTSEPEVDTRESDVDGSLPAERSPWPMLLFTGVAVVIGALLLRWILVPRAG